MSHSNTCPGPTTSLHWMPRARPVYTPVITGAAPVRLVVGSSKMLPQAIKTRLHWLPYRLILRFGRQFGMEGVNLVVLWQNADRAEILRAKVASALLLIKNHAPKYYARVQRFTPNVLILGGHFYNATYISDLKLCDIAVDFALSESTGAEQMAMTLVHEATHGYLRSRGVAYEEDRRPRVERICVRAEISLASRLPGTDALVAEARRCLDYGPEYWTNRSFLQREVEGLTKAGIPRFVIRRVERIQSRRWGLDSAKKTQPGSSPNGGPATPIANSGVPEGPPSVS